MQEMVYNRTAKDVDDALRIREEKVKKTISLTDEEKAIMEKGFLTLNAVNRIENKISQVVSLMNDMGYYDVQSETKQWQIGDIFAKEDFERILGIVKKLKKSFFVYQTTPQTLNKTYHWQTINSIEKILYDLEKMVNEVKSFYLECGTFQCGERI